MILQSKTIESAVIEITCGDKTGTAFCVYTEADSQFLLTAYHTVEDHTTDNAVHTIVDGVNVRLDVLAYDSDLDVAVISIAGTSLKTLPLSGDQIAYDSTWETYGFPANNLGYCSRFQGTISTTVVGSTWDISLTCDQFNAEVRFDGLSGAPLVIEGKVTGVISQQLGYGLGARSVRAITTILDTHRIPYTTEPIGEVPASIELDSKESRPNITVLNYIDERIGSDHLGGYLLVSGNPGSGKTTLAAQWQPNEAHLELVDRYFVKVPETEEIPTHLRAMPDRFMRWVEEVYCRVLYQEPPARSSKNAHERILEIHNGVRQLAEHFKNKNQVGVLIIDGLDDIKPELLDSFFAFLPAKLPDHLKVLLFATGRVSLPATLRNSLASEAEIKVTPLSILQAKSFFSQRLSHIGLTDAQLDTLARKSEGHPLYLRYLSQCVHDADTVTDIDAFIDTIPVISGDIEVYYQDIWDKISNSPAESAITATLARMREGVHQDQLFLMMDQYAKQGFDSGLKKVRHLLRDGQELSIYHSSFSDFLQDRTKVMDQEIHDRLAQFCLDYPELYYSVSEKIYHLLNGSNVKQQLAPKACNQEWVDMCAMNGVIPEVTLEDIRNVVRLAASQGKAEELIALLLLSQRVYFRYDQLFHEHAYYLALALLALGKPKEAMRYIIRNKSIVVDDHSALVLLQELYENEYTQQAKELMEAIDLRCDSYLTHQDEPKINEFINLRFKSITISVNEDDEEAGNQLMDAGKKLLQWIEVNGNPVEVIVRVKHQLYSYHAAYRIHLYGHSCGDIIDQLEKTAQPPTSEFTTYLAMCINRYHTLSSQSILESDEKEIMEWIRQLEICTERYGYEPDSFYDLIRAMMRYSKNTELTASLISKGMPITPKYSLRGENGVDIQQSDLSELILYGECLGYTGLVDTVPEVTSFHSLFWEDALMERFNALAYISGLCKRFKNDAALGEMDSVWDEFKGIVEILTPSLNHRIEWDRSYLLPEQLYPVIFTLVVQIGTDHFPEQLTELISLILADCDDQMGLYTEGYTDCLLAMMLEMKKSGMNDKETFRLAKVAEDHVLRTAENRWERNEYLLRIAEIYGKIGSQERAVSVFKEMIDTSMGPSWYKEAQLGIINSAIRYIKPSETASNIFRLFAGHLEHASGEMTFQRYVKQQQEGFIGELSNVGRLEQAIACFRYLLLPDYAVVKENAEGSLMDMPVNGKGYLQGARSIEEQSGILNLLEGLDVSCSLATWSLTELFIPGDTRYLNRFAKIQAKILEQSDSLQFDQLTTRLVRFYQREADLEDRKEYMETLLKQLPEPIQTRLLAAIKAKGIPEQFSVRIEESYSSSREPEPYEREIIQAGERVKAQLKMENQSGARKTIVTALEKAQKERRGIWNDYTSNHIGELREMLKLTYRSPADLLPDLKELIYQESYGDTWELAARLLEILESVGDENQKQGILSAVEFHVKMMVRTPDKVFSRYDFLLQPLKQSDPELALIELLIWLLNHPILVVKTRAMELLTWLFTVKDEWIIPALCKEIMSEGYKFSRELSAAVLHQCASLDPSEFWKFFSNELKGLQIFLMANPHFMIIDSVLRAMEQVAFADLADLQVELNNFRNLFKGKAVLGRDVELSEPHLRPVRQELQQLMDLSILDGRFCRELLLNIEQILPLPLDETIRVSEYIDRSFNDYHHIRTVRDYDLLLRYVLNTAVVPAVPVAFINPVAGILRCYQPDFPERKMVMPESWFLTLPNLLSALFESDDNALEVLLNADNMIFHYYYEENVKRTGPKRAEDLEIELLSFAVPEQLTIDENLELFQPVFADNDYYNGNPQVEDGCIPIVIPSQSTEVTNCDHVAGEFNHQADQIFECKLVGELSTDHWREGRIWGMERFGLPMRQGSVISVRKELGSMKSGYKMVWQVCRNEDIIIIDCSSKQMFEI